MFIARICASETPVRRTPSRTVGTILNGAPNSPYPQHSSRVSTSLFTALKFTVGETAKAFRAFPHVGVGHRRGCREGIAKFHCSNALANRPSRIARSRSSMKGAETRVTHDTFRNNGRAARNHGETVVVRASPRHPGLAFFTRDKSRGILHTVHALLTKISAHLLSVRALNLPCSTATSP